MRIQIIVTTLTLACAVSATAQVGKSLPSQTDLKRAATERKIAAVRPLPRAIKADRIRALLRGKVAATVLDDPIPMKTVSLSVRNSVIDSVANLKFMYAERVSSEENGAMLLPNPDGSLNGSTVAIFFNPTAPGIYVFDVGLASDYLGDKTQQLTFIADFDAQQAQQKTFTTKDDHLLFLTEIKSAGDGWHLILLTGKFQWTFSTVEISQFK